MTEPGRSSDVVPSEAALTLYERLIRGPLPRGQVGDEEANALVESGFAEVVPYTGNLTALAPSTVMATVLLKGQSEIALEQRDLATLHAHIASLQSVFEGQRPGSDTQLRVRVLTDPSEIASASNEILNSARSTISEMLTHESGDPHEGPVAEQDLPLGLAEGKLHMRSLYDERALALQGADAEIRRWQKNGAEARLHPNIPVCMTCADDRAALIALDLRPSKGALHIETPSLARTLQGVFDRLWAEGRPYGDPAGTQNPLTPAQQRILALLARGEKDETIARSLGMSVRTIRRHVEHLLEKLGTETRFAAGVEAQRRGWIRAL